VVCDEHYELLINIVVYTTFRFLAAMFTFGSLTYIYTRERGGCGTMKSGTRGEFNVSLYSEQEIRMKMAREKTYYGINCFSILHQQ
jgi:hypothetical protein